MSSPGVFVSVLVTLCSGLASCGQPAVPPSAPVLANRGEPHEPLALAIVYSGQEIWIGNDEVEPTDEAQYNGTLKGLEAAIDALGLARRSPDDLGLVVRYATRARLVVAPGPITRLTGAALGTQADYRGQLGNDLAAGVALGLGELAKAPAKRKVLIVIGDGNGNDSRMDVPALVAARAQAAAAGVDVHAIVYKSAISLDGNIVHHLTDDVATVNSPEAIGSRLAAIFDQCCRADAPTHAAHAGR